MIYTGKEVKGHMKRPVPAIVEKRSIGTHKGNCHIRAEKVEKLGRKGSRCGSYYATEDVRSTRKVFCGACWCGIAKEMARTGGGGISEVERTSGKKTQDQKKNSRRAGQQPSRD